MLTGRRGSFPFVRGLAFLGVAVSLFSFPGGGGQKTGGPGAPASPGALPPPPLELVRTSSADDLVRFLPQSGFHAETRRDLRWIDIGRQKWLNFGFYRRKMTSLKPDWPISVIFYGRATVDKVKRLFGKRRLSTLKYVCYDDGAGMAWAADRGVKTGVWFIGPDGPDEDVLHLRVFAPPAGYFEGAGDWGHYVVATAHLDFNPPFDFSCGHSEDAERRILRMAEAQGLAVFADYLNLSNAEAFRVRRGYYWHSNGYASLVHIR